MILSCLVSSNVIVHDRRVGPHIGSDHYPVVIDFSISAKREAQKRRLAQRRKGRQVRRKYTNRRFTQMDADLGTAKRNTSRQLSAISSQQDSKLKSKPRFDGWNRARYRNRQLAGLARFISEREGPIILLGDLNVTPWSPYFTDFLRKVR